MAKLADFDDKMERLSKEYYKIKGYKEAQTGRERGQRRRRTEEAINRYTAILEDKSKTAKWGDMEQFQKAAMVALAEKKGVLDSVGGNIMEYGVPKGADVVDDTDYEEMVETINNPTITTEKETFGDKHKKFGRWLINYYIPSREWASEKYYSLKTSESKANFLKWLSHQLRKQMKENGIEPVKMEVFQEYTKLYYSSGRTHILR